MVIDTDRYGTRFQSSLGTQRTRRYKESSNIDRISFAKVTRVNYRYNTVDVTTSHGSLDSGTGGRMSAKLPVQFSGTTQEGKPFGQVNPIEIGTRVLIGFVEGEKTTPVVLGIYGNEQEAEKLSRTPFEGADPEDEDLKQLAQQQFTVHPSLTYENIDGVGNRTVSFTGKSFVTTEAGANPEAGGISDNSSGTQYEDLDSSYYYTGELIEPKEDKAPVILFKHQGDKFARNEEGSQEDGHSFMWFLDDDGTFRTSIMQEDEDWRAYFEMTPEGTIQMVRQNDTKELNRSTDRYSVGVEEGGIRLQVGDRYSLITPDGTYGNLGLGGGGGGSGGSGGVPDDVMDRINETLDEANRKILKMGTYFERTDAFITMGADLLLEVEDGMVQYESNFTILAEEIRASVSETVLKDLVNDELNSFISDIEEVSEEAREQLEIIKGLVKDGRLTAEEKAILTPGYMNIKIEYPAYLEQAKKNDKDTKRYERAYKELVEMMDPIMENPSETSVVDPLVFNEKYSNYYNTRQELLSGILYGLQKDMIELAEETSKVAKDATKALGDAGKAITSAQEALSSLKSIADSDTATPQEKRELKREIDKIINEYEEYVVQAEEFEIDSGVYTEAYETLMGFIETTGVLDDLTETTELNGQMLYDYVEAYYKERIRIITNIAKESSEQLKGLHANFEQHSTEIKETSQEISLIAESVVATEESIDVSMAKLSIMSDRISSTVTKTSFKREIEDNRNNLNATGRNLYALSTAHDGVAINPNDGKTRVEPGATASAYIRVNSGILYTGSLFQNTINNTFVIAYYDLKQNHISSASTSLPSGEEYVELIAPAPEGAKFARVSVDGGKSIRVQYERGSSSGFFMNSNEDLLNNLEYATEEKKNREISWQDKNTRMIKATNESASFLQDLAEIFNKLDVSEIDAEYLVKEVEDLEEEYDKLITEATDLDIQTINVELAMSTLKTTVDTYIKPLVTAGGTLTEAEQEQVMKRFTDYLGRRDGYYKQVNDKFKLSYDASVEVLDDVLAGSLEAERIAREAAIAAEQAAQNLSTLERQNSDGKVMEARHLDVIRAIVKNDVLTPVDKEKGITIVNEISDEIDWLIAQGRSTGLSTNDLENAHIKLISYFSAFVTPEKMLKDSKINAQTFEANFQAYHTSKLTFIANLIQEAKENLKGKELDARTARDETIRRDKDLQVIKNIIDDSELAIQRIEKKVETLENTHAYAIEVLSTNGFTFKDRIIDTKLKVTVRRGTDDITEEIKPKDFEWDKTLANGKPDTTWNKLHKGIGRELELTHEDVQGKATFTVEVYLDEEER